MERSAGILLPVFSLPSREGIGTLGAPAYAFADFLRAAGQRWWQILPVGPAGAGESPYSGVSARAGNPLLIDLALLVQDGLLTAAELEGADFGAREDTVDYGALTAAKLALLRAAFRRRDGRQAAAAEAFVRAQAEWLPDYALFMAIRARYDSAPWQTWPDEGLRRREAGALARARTELAAEIAFYCFVQYLFFAQWQALRAYVNAAGVSILGDMPIYVSLDSADVWAAQENFLLDDEGYPTEVSGVPPDYFCADGQLWGNPLYNWDAMARDGYGWWIRRVGGAAALFDAVRIDHFRGFESYWAVPAAAATAKEGRWRKGPGMALVGTLTGWFSSLQFVAEDLGLLTPAVGKLLADSGLPGMKVLEFAFGGGPDNLYLPHNHVRRSICYTGTHDNAPVLGWWAAAGAAERAAAENYLGVSGAEAVRAALLRCGLGSVCQLFVAQMQDWLGLGESSRINVPGRAEGNWRWRMTAAQLAAAPAAEIRALTYTYGRCAEETFAAAAGESAAAD